MPMLRLEDAVKDHVLPAKDIVRARDHAEHGVASVITQMARVVDATPAVLLPPLIPRFHLHQLTLLPVAAVVEVGAEAPTVEYHVLLPMADQAADALPDNICMSKHKVIPAANAEPAVFYVLRVAPLQEMRADVPQSQHLLRHLLLVKQIIVTLHPAEDVMSSAAADPKRVNLPVVVEAPPVSPDHHTLRPAPGLKVTVKQPKPA
jgi:hypothetical protein